MKLRAFIGQSGQPYLHSDRLTFDISLVLPGMSKEEFEELLGTLDEVGSIDVEVRKHAA